MAIVKRGSIVLINYPFSDLSNNKVRPALIIMSDDLLKKTDDILCIFISSAIYKSTLPSDFELKKNNQYFNKTGLKVDSVFRTHKIALLHKKLVQRILGELDASLIKKIEQHLKIALNIE